MILVGSLRKHLRPATMIPSIFQKLLTAKYSNQTLLSGIYPLNQRMQGCVHSLPTRWTRVCGNSCGCPHHCHITTIQAIMLVPNHLQNHWYFLPGMLYLMPLQLYALMKPNDVCLRKLPRTSRMERLIRKLADYSN